MGTRRLATHRQRESLVAQVAQQGKQNPTMLVARPSLESSKQLIANRSSEPKANTTPGAVDHIQVLRPASRRCGGRLGWASTCRR